MSHRPNVYTSPNASGLVRAALESGRDRGDSATPKPTMSNLPIQQRGPVMNSGNNSQSGFTARPNMSQQSVRSGGSGSSAPKSQGGVPINRPSGFTNHPNNSQNSVRSGGPQNPQHSHNQGRQGISQPRCVIHPSTSQNSLRWGGSQNQGPPPNNNQPHFTNNQNSNQQPLRSGPSQMQGGPLHNRHDSSSSGSSGNSLQRFNGSKTNPAVSMSFGGPSPSQQSQGRSTMNPPQVRSTSLYLLTLLY